MGHRRRSTTGAVGHRRSGAGARGLGTGAGRVPRTTRGSRSAERDGGSHVSYLQGRLESELIKVFDSALWHRKGHEPEPLPRRQLNALASELADSRFPEAPRLLNELLNRSKPSSSAVAAQNVLLRRMALHEDEERLEYRRLFHRRRAVRVASGSHQAVLPRRRTGWRFVSPGSSAGDSCERRSLQLRARLGGGPGLSSGQRPPEHIGRRRSTTSGGTLPSESRTACSRYWVWLSSFRCAPTSSSTGKASFRPG